MIDHVKAMLHCWYLGSMSGTTLANIVSGKVNPSGKLPVTFARKQTDYPCFQFGKRGYPGVDGHVYYDEGIYVGYRHFNTKHVAPQFPFGYGLSYTTFRYGSPTLSATSLSATDSLTLSVPITNTGRTKGKEVVELFIGEEHPAEERPTKELKNFVKVELDPGETKTVSFTIKPSDLAYWSTRSHTFTSTPGRFKAYICASETDVRTTAAFSLK